METAKITFKGQVTIPKKVQTDFGYSSRGFGNLFCGGGSGRLETL